ncbi:MAG: hypothetical protein AB7P24_05780 [Nitrospira sp.]
MPRKISVSRRCGAILLGRAGSEHLRNNFLLPRSVRDELRLIKQLVG